MEFLIFVAPVVGGLLLYLLIRAIVRGPGSSLHSKFVKLGTLRGRPLKEITSVCGEPNSVSVTKDGNTVRQWMATGYHIVLLFDKNDICLGVTSETKVK